MNEPPKKPNELAMRLQKKLNISSSSPNSSSNAPSVDSPMASGLKRLSSVVPKGSSLPETFDRLMNISSQTDNSLEGDLLRIKSMVMSMADEDEDDEQFFARKQDIRSLLSSSTGIEFIRIILKYEDEEIIRWGLRLSWLVIRQYQEGMFEPYVWHFLEYFTTADAFDYFLRLALKNTRAKDVQKVVFEILFGEIKRPNTTSLNIEETGTRNRRTLSCAASAFDMGKSKVRNSEIFRSLVTLVCASEKEDAIDICRQMSLLMLDADNCKSLLKQDNWVNFLVDILKAHTPLFNDDAVVTTLHQFGRLGVYGSLNSVPFTKEHVQLINLCVSIFTSVLIHEIFEDSAFTNDSRFTQVLNEFQEQAASLKGSIVFIRMLMHSLITNISKKEMQFKRDLQQIGWRNLFTLERNLLDFVLFRNQASKGALKFAVGEGDCLDAVIVMIFGQFIHQFEEFEFSSQVNPNLPAKVAQSLWKNIRRSQDLFSKLNQFVSKIHVRREPLEREVADLIVAKFQKDVKHGLRRSFYSEISKDDMLRAIVVAQRLAALQKKHPSRLVNFNVVNVINNGKRKNKMCLLDFEYYTEEDLTPVTLKKDPPPTLHRRSFSLSKTPDPFAAGTGASSKKIIIREEMFGPALEEINMKHVTALYVQHVDELGSDQGFIDRYSNALGPPKLAKANQRSMSSKSLNLTTKHPEDAFQHFPCLLRYKGRHYKQFNFLSEETRKQFVQLTSTSCKLDVIRPKIDNFSFFRKSSDDNAFECTKCKIPFSKGIRKVSCKLCAESFCTECCGRKIALPELTLAKNTQSIHRVCENCFEKRGEMFVHSPQIAENDGDGNGKKSRFSAISESASHKFSSMKGSLSRSFTKKNSKLLSNSLSQLSEEDSNGSGAESPKSPKRLHRRSNSMLVLL